jgi:hypothetical protein
MAFGLRGILAIIIPSAVGMLILAHPLIDLVLAHGAETSADADSTGAALALFALGLPGFCTFLYMVRVFQSMQDTRTAFRLYLVENGLNIVMALALVGPLGVRGLALSLSIAYTAAALLALAVVRNRVGGLGGPDLTTPLKRVLGASGVMALATVLALSVSGATSGFALLARVVLAVVVGVVAYVATAGLLGARASRRVREERVRRARPEAPPRPPTARPVQDNGEDRPPAGPVAPGQDTAPDPFRGRLHDQSGGLPYRHLRPLGRPPEPEAEAGPEHELRTGDEEEDLDGPDSGGDR